MLPESRTIAEVDHDDDWLLVSWNDGTESRFPAIWLRDNIPSGRHTPQGQRLFDVAALPDRITLRAATRTGDGVTVTFDPEGVEDAFTASWLREHDLDLPATVEHAPILWAAEKQEEIEFADFASVATSRQALAGWLRHVVDYGFGLLRGVPVEPGAVLDVVRLFGYVRETNYGRLFDVLTKPSPANLANTRLEVGPHTDNPYRDPVPGLQLLHCLESEVEGGESVLVDGFAVAEKIRLAAPDRFDMLTRHPVPFRYEDAGVVLATSRPLIEVDTAGNVVGVRYNSRSAAPIRVESASMPAFYEAYRHLGRALADPAHRVMFRLTPGDLMMFDNQRVLHARTSFTGDKRHLQGCYADKDSLRSLLRVIES